MAGDEPTAQVEKARGTSQAGDSKTRDAEPWNSIGGPGAKRARAPPACTRAQLTVSSLLRPQDWNTVSFGGNRGGGGGGGGGGGPKQTQAVKRPGGAGTSSGISAAALENETDELKRECSPRCPAENEG